MIRIRRAGVQDLDEILELLDASGLTKDGVREHLSRFLVAEEDGRIVATAGLEMGAAAALLRSVAVAPSARGDGLGAEIVRQALRLASVSGASTVYLMTTTAAAFFARLNFSPALRAEIDAAFPDSPEIRPGGCGPSADAMALRDLVRALEPRPRRK